MPAASSETAVSEFRQQANTLATLYLQPFVAVAAGLVAVAVENNILVSLLFLVNAAVTMNLILRLDKVDDRRITSWQVTGTAWAVGLPIFAVADSLTIAVLLVPTLCFPALLFAGIQLRETERGSQIKESGLPLPSLNIDPEELPETAGTRVFGSVCVFGSVVAFFAAALIGASTGDFPTLIAPAILGGYIFGTIFVYYSFRKHPDEFTFFRSLKAIVSAQIVGVAALFTLQDGTSFAALIGIVALLCGLLYPGIVGLWSLSPTPISERIGRRILGLLAEESTEETPKTEQESAADEGENKSDGGSNDK